MDEHDSGHLVDPEASAPAAVPAQPPAPAAPLKTRGRVLPIVALVLAVIALIMAFIPYACFAAGLPALAAIVLGFVALVVPGRRAVAVTALIVGAVALIVAVVVSVLQITGPLTRFVSDANGLVSQIPGEDSTAVPGLSAGAHRITYTTSGTGHASISYSVVVDGTSGTDRESDVPLPHDRTQRVTVSRTGEPAQFVMVVIAQDTSKPVTCSIAIDGAEVTHHASSGISGAQFVTCTARTG